MREAVICEPLRTPVGRFGGVLARRPRRGARGHRDPRAAGGAPDCRPTRVDDVILGQCYPNGEAPAIGRVAALDAGLPVEVTGLQLDRRCGSGLQAVAHRGHAGADRRAATWSSPAAPRA